MTQETLSNVTGIYRPVRAVRLLRVVGLTARTVAIGLAFGAGLLAAGLCAGYVLAPALFAALGA